MRKVKVVLQSFTLVAAILTPAALAVLQLGLGLSGVERMKARVASQPRPEIASVGHYETDPMSGEDGLRFRTVIVHH